MSSLLKKIKSIFTNKGSKENTDWINDINSDLYNEYIDFTGYTVSR